MVVIIDFLNVAYSFSITIFYPRLHTIIHSNDKMGIGTFCFDPFGPEIVVGSIKTYFYFLPLLNTEMSQEAKIISRERLVHIYPAYLLTLLLMTSQIKKSRHRYPIVLSYFTGIFQFHSEEGQYRWFDR